VPECHFLYSGISKVQYNNVKHMTITLKTEDSDPGFNVLTDPQVRAQGVRDLFEWKMHSGLKMESSLA